MTNKLLNQHIHEMPLCHKPNFLVILVDQQRYAVSYENEEIKVWRKTRLKAQEFLKSRGFEFKNHYAGSAACCPSRATLYTGQYPSLHGVSQTDGAAKGAYDPDMFWLNPNTVPTMGDYFRTAGYQTYWKGKWHASAADILVPGTHKPFLSYNQGNGVPIPDNEKLYINANVLASFGFNGWIGPEPHGVNPRNTGSSAAAGLSGRDVVYSQDTVELIRVLEKEYNESDECRPRPWLIMCSFVNPHDIALFGAISGSLPQFNFKVNLSVPYISPAPTASESLLTKPSAQSSYRRIYAYAFQPLLDTLFYRQLYYSLEMEADTQICRVINALRETSFYNNTIIIFTSDHGELLGAHGLFQKWYQAYEESIHVPLIIHNPTLFDKPESTDMLTSHVDILPTMLGISGLDTGAIHKVLANSHTEVHSLVGRNLSPLLKSKTDFIEAGEAIYFMTDDNITKGLNQISFAGVPYHSVAQPNSIETVIAALPTGRGGTKQIWKYSRYFDNPHFWNISGRRDQFVYNGPVRRKFNPCNYNDTPIRPQADQYEIYNITTDPLEIRNVSYESYNNRYFMQIREILNELLEEQRKKKRLYPVSGNVHGKTPNY
ncbi:sulfatase [Desulfofarcimen acetoxidans DSM 771]|uniref:Sulfatase n=1 Tax=Desulfofarcimen acetoxidans (strain ATCC 49208 / DSM 771 / KCTC 5769 / VKM B-1644 / 5575) TaxID=485916 RepID=C8VYX4_DESAS|nr:sulfatase-like hydrolase/transferase [Desulfofarcimen acetoxidans]ACV62884.1 sulfatase [Desulfofarcimen acetoxidans DSM 771]